MINAKLLQLVIAASNDGIVIAEREGNDNIIIYVNPAFEKLSGYTADEILYQDCRFLQGSDRQQPERHLIREALQNHQPCRHVIRNYKRDGSLFWNELSITPVYNEADQITYFIGIQKDVSTTIQAQQRILDLENKVKQLQQLLCPRTSPQPK